MKNKGFTLVEVMGVIVVLAILVVVAVPAIMTLMKNNENAEYDIMINDLKNAAELYISLYPEQFSNFEEGQTVTITVGQLQDAELIKVDLINPKTGEQVPPAAGINVTNRLGKNDIVIDFDREGEVGGYTFVKDFEYTGAGQELTVPETGYYKIELWGASGCQTSTNYGKGGYTTGAIQLQKNEKLYFFVGAEGCSDSTNYTALTFNGGGEDHTANNIQYSRGGGATDVRLKVNSDKFWKDSVSLRSRIAVASGGGGGGSNGTAAPNGGGLIGTAPRKSVTPGTQKIGHAFGYGRGGYGSQSYSGSGGGYFGGSSTSASPFEATGGSSFLSGYAGSNAVIEEGGTVTQPVMSYNTKHYSGKIFVNGKMEIANNSGPGKAKITYLSRTAPIKKRTDLNNVRYVEACSAGSYTGTSLVNHSNHFVELQAIDTTGENVAKGKVAATSLPLNASYTTIHTVDGDIDTSKYTSPLTGPAVKTEQCVTVDLGENYNLNEVAGWWYFNSANRKFIDKRIRVGTTRDNMRTIYTCDMLECPVDTSEGIRINAWNLEAIY